jgi:V/A-type H+-transporting ATPase subunit I
MGWVPRPELEPLRRAAADELGPEVVIDEVPVSPEDAERAPVLIRSAGPVRPFEGLVRLLALPRPGTIDPTPLMAVFLPLFFGIMLGDIAHGLVLGAAALALRRKLAARSPAARDLAVILAMGAAWGIVWGVLFGEFLGDLGRRFGIRPLWMSREEALAPLLVFAVAVGAVHVGLGLALGTLQAARARSGRALAEKLGLLAALAGLFLVAGAAAGRLPAGVMRPSVAAAAVGVAVLVRAGGPTGAITAPLEVLGAVGNVLSYLRIAAIGLASVYLSRVANELGAAGPLWLGIVVATLFHALNVALGAFSPTIQALRLHYVEFFGKFFEPGGRAYEPFG